MKLDNDRPQTGRGSNLLGVRVDGDKVDISSDEAGNVHPQTGGMSVSPSIAAMHDEFPFLVPKRLRSLPEYRDAVGSNSRRIFAMGRAGFHACNISDRLHFRPDKPYHGLVEPTEDMSLSDYEQAIFETIDLWADGEPPADGEGNHDGS